MKTGCMRGGLDRFGGVEVAEETGGVGLDFLLSLGGHFIEGAVGHSEALVAFEALAVALEEVPVEVVEGAGFGAGFGGDGVGAGAAIVGHFVDVGTAGAVGFGSEEAAVGEEAHAADVGQLDPLIGIGIDDVEPIVDFAGVKAGKEGEVAEHHEALDVVGVGVFAGFADALREAVHAGGGAPVKRGEGAVGFEEIGGFVVGHFKPVDSADVFAPAEDLPDESLDGVEGGVAGLVGGFGGTDAVQGQEETAVEVMGDVAVIHPRFVLEHGVLIVAEAGEAFLDEMVEDLKGVLMGDGVMEGLEVTEMVGEFAGDVIEGLAGDGVGREAGGLGDDSSFGRGFAVVVIVVPLAALGVIAVHEDVIAAAHLAVEEFHAELFAAFGPAREIFGAAEETVVGEDFDGGAEGFVPGFDFFEDAVFAGGGEVKGMGLKGLEGALRLGAEGTGVVGVVDAGVVNGEAALLEFGGKVAHRGEDEGDFLFMVPYGGGLRFYLRHPDVIGGGVEGGEARKGVAELVAEDKGEFHKRR